MTDQIKKIGDSIVQHGPANNRAYLMKLATQDFPGIIGQLERLAADHGYTKIFAKVPGMALKQFLDNGYELEAAIPGFYPEDDCYFLGKYYCQNRKQELEYKQVRTVLATAQQQRLAGKQQLPEGFTCRMAEASDAQAMACVYRTVFASYPFPIFNPEYLKKIMGTTVFFGVWEEHKLVALASAEMDESSKSVEMTDFATLTACRGHGLALYLLQQMEEEMKTRGMKTFYTIARAYSHGMNITFARNGYTYAGTLTNNTNISGSLESMNIWHKKA